ncbi:MAG: 50S ribosomal protein L5 [Patescibacteria group bacterium]
MQRLRDKYIREVIPAMEKQFGFTNAMAVPRLLKVVLNSGTGKALKDEKYLDAVVSTLQRISGQKPVMTKAKKSISAFKIRAGMTIGVMVTLRGTRMYDFIDKLINVTLARVRDFQGLERSAVDHHGNFSVGFKEHIVFPEIRSDEIERIHGLQVNISTSAKTQAEGVALMSFLGFPFKKEVLAKK